MEECCCCGETGDSSSDEYDIVICFLKVFFLVQSLRFHGGGFGAVHLGVCCCTTWIRGTGSRKGFGGCFIQSLVEKEYPYECPSDNMMVHPSDLVCSLKPSTYI